MKILLCVFFGMMSFAHAQSLKDDFINKIVEECGKTKEQATELATPGRSGNVVKLKLCPGSPLTISDDCKIKCSSQKGNVVGN